MKSNVGLLALLCLGMLLVQACSGGGTDCTPHETKLCRDGATYWVDSCGTEGEKAEDCECECNADNTDCMEPCCEPSCTGRECGPDGCGGGCPPGCAVDRVCNDSTGQCQECLIDLDCGAGEVCVDGTCEISCPTGLSNCNGVCVDTQTDSMNCGYCGNECDTAVPCEEGACQPCCVFVDCGIDPVCGENCGECLPGNCPINQETGKVTDEDDTSYRLPDVLTGQPAIVVEGEIPGMYGGGWCEPATIWYRFSVDGCAFVTINLTWENTVEDGFAIMVYSKEEYANELGFVTWDITAVSPVEFTFAADDKHQYYLRLLKWYQSDPPTRYTMQISAEGVPGSAQDTDSDCIPDDGDQSGVAGDNPCTGGAVVDCDDNCPQHQNLSQTDEDEDGLGDACDPDYDSDGDGIPDMEDNCPGTPSSECNIFTPCSLEEGVCNETGHCSIHSDDDSDGIGNVCDPCPQDPPTLCASDADCGAGEGTCISATGLCSRHRDFDGDMTGDDCGDNCPDRSNPEQIDTDSDGIGDVCDPDDDNDGVEDNDDNCQLEPNVNQDDFDSDSIGDVCDNCVLDSNPDQSDLDGDAKGDVCDEDADGDGILDDGDGSGTKGDNPCTGGATTDCDDNCPLTQNPTQDDADGDGAGDVCDYTIINEVEPNDRPDYQDLGTISPDNIYRILGECSLTGNDGSTWTGDEDLYYFTVDTAGTLEVTMDWNDSGSDYDVVIYQLVGADLTAIDGYAGAGVSKPETTSAQVETTSTYAVAVYGWDGTAGSYTADIVLSP